MLIIEKTGLPHDVNSKEHLKGTHLPIIGLGGITIQEVHQDLQHRRNKPIKSYAEFNGKVLISEMTLDECYQAVTGKTKSEFEQDKLAQIKAHKEERTLKKHKILIRVVENQIFFNNQANVNYSDFISSLISNYHTSIYDLMEYDACLDIMIAIDKKLGELKKQKDIENYINGLLEEQNHSGSSYQIVQSLLKRFTNYYGFYND